MAGMLDAQPDQGTPTAVIDADGSAIPAAPPAPPRPAPASTPLTNVAPPTPAGEPPATIEIPKAPGKDAPMEVVMAAEVLRRVNRTRQCVSLVSQVIIRSYEEEALHAEVCRHLVAFGGYLMAWIGIAEEKPERFVRPIAHAGLEANFLSALRITWSNDLANRSPTSRAIQEQRPYVARNILQEPRYAVLRKEAQLYGYTATCALPLQFAQFGMGVLTIHAMEPDAFNAEEVSLLRELANDLSAGVVGLRERGKRQAMEERLVAVVDASDDAIIGCDLDGRITDWNAGATRMYGYQREEAVGRLVGLLIATPETREEIARVRASVTRGDRPARFETERLCKEGKVIPTSVMISPIFAADGVVVGSTSVEHDLTAARAAELAQRTAELEESEVARLKAVEAVRRTFISEASHELNTPLTPLRIHVEALGEREDLTPGQREHLTVIDRNVTRLCHLVEDMLEASRLETGRFKLALEDVRLAVLAEETLGGLAEAAAAAGVTLNTGPMPRFKVHADRNRVGQVFYNVVRNAIAFTPPGGTVTVSARVEKDVQAAVVRVTDTGVGLTEEQLGRLFQPFSRPHDGRNGPKGTGLGLFISKGIVEQHGGRIWAASDGPGQGATFSFTLPLAALPAPVPEHHDGRRGGIVAADRPARPAPAREAAPDPALAQAPEPAPE